MKLIQLVALALGVLGTITATAETNGIAYSGVVTDAKGLPVSGAAVEFWEYEIGTESSPKFEIKQSVSSGTNGAFELTLTQGFGQIIAHKPGVASAWKHWFSQERILGGEHRFVLSAPTTLAGTVVDNADKPVANAEVFVSIAMMESPEGEKERQQYLIGPAAKKLFVTRSGADGRFCIEGFPTNAVADLDAITPGKALRDLRQEDPSPETMMCRAGQKDIKLVLDPTGSIEGKVVVEGGSYALTNAQLWLQPDQSRALFRHIEPIRTGTNGVFLFSNVSQGGYTIHAAFGTTAAVEWVAESVPVTVKAGETTRDVRVAGIKGGVLEVSVVSSVDRKPLSQVAIHVYSSKHQGMPARTGATDTNGVLLLRLPAGNYQVHAFRDAMTGRNSAATIEAGQTNRIEFELTPPPTVSGRVLNLDGTPAAGMSVTVMPNYNMKGSVTTDTNGHYELKWRPENHGGGSGPTYCLLVRDFQRNLAAAQEIDESTKTADLKLAPGQIIAGRVEDSNGKPLTNASVHLIFWSGNSGAWIDQDKIKVDAQGRFEDVALPRDRRYGIGVSAKGYGTADSQNLQDTGDRIEVPKFTLKSADKKLAGRVVDADEKPVAGVRISSYGEGQPQIGIESDSKGEFSVEVCEGTINLSAWKQSSHGSVRAEGGDTNVVITLGRQSGGGMPQPPKRRSLTGSALPDLASVGFASDVAPSGKPVLLCLFDVEQRPSRRFVRQLVEQYDGLRQKGVTLLGVQAALASADSIKEWKDANPVPFPMAIVAEKSSTNKWVLDTESLPWLILTDEKGQVTAEGFGLEELDAKLAGKR